MHAYLDPVKMITNRFKGGMMAQTADKLCLEGAEVVYLTAKGSKEPDRANDADAKGMTPPNRIKLVYHDGLHDYMEKVLELAPKMDAVVLGAAVANLIPVTPFKEKFPSHNYKPGDIIPIDFTIAPRVIDQVKDVMKPTAHLFGFKLLAGQPHEELISAAYGVLLESRASCVFANDPTVRDGFGGLATKYAVTKERGVHKMNLDDVPAFILTMLEDEYYSTISVKTTGCKGGVQESWDHVDKLIQKHQDKFTEVEGGLVFGTVAVRVCDKNYPNAFVTTARGKRELEGRVLVLSVDHDTQIVTTLGDCAVPGTTKATLNAPLLHWIFSQYPKVDSIVHTHDFDPDFPTYRYAPPGTKRDSVRGLPCKSFNVEGHGVYVLLNDKGEAIW